MKLIKVGISGYANFWTMSTDKSATSKSTQLSTKVRVKLFLWLENALKLNLEALKLTENLNPLQGPTHTLTSSSKNYVWIYHGMHWTQHYKQKLYISHWKARIWLPMAFKTIPDTPAEATEPSFRKVSPPPAKLRILFPAHLWVREFWPQIYSLWQSLDWGLLSNILASMKMGRA